MSRDEEGRVVLVTGALPGETVRAVLSDARRSFARAETVEVLQPSPDRVAPPCPHVGEGCGGCGWQHVAPAAQGLLKAEVVRDNLRRLARLPDADVRVGPGIAERAYRTTVKVVITGGSPGFRRRASHQVVPVDDCLVAHPLVAQMMHDSYFGPASEATLRCGARTGERLALLSPTAVGARLPGDVTVVGRADLARGAEAWVYEEVAGARFRVSALSFAQASPEGSELLVAAVEEALAGAPEGPMVDAYGGTGIFAATIGRGRAVTLLETSASAVADARTNVPHAQVVRTDVARWRPRRATVVVADPPRGGLGPQAAGRLASTGASHIALVSCDPASLGRDAALLAGHGFVLDRSVVLDLFPGTPHLEAVTRFTRPALL